MITLDRNKFWDLYRDSFGSSDQQTVNALNTILDKMETDKRLTFVSWHAYPLATAYHETGWRGSHFVPIKEGKGRPGSRAWRYQVMYWATGFYGRGLVQLTHEENYRKMGRALGVGDMFVKNPDLVLDVSWAYDIMVVGMVNGMFRGNNSLGKYLKADQCSIDDYFQCREIINGDKNTVVPGNALSNGMMIARYAKSFERILLASQVPATATPIANASEAPAGDKDKETTPTPDPQLPAIPQEPGNSPGVGIVDVPIVTPATPEAETVDKKLEKWSARWAMIPTAVGGAAMTFFSWLKDSPIGITITLVAATAGVVGLYMGIRQIGAILSKKRADNLILERERRAHEIQMALINAGASKDLNAINLVKTEIS